LIHWRFYLLSSCISLAHYKHRVVVSWSYIYTSLETRSESTVAHKMHIVDSFSYSFSIHDVPNVIQKLIQLYFAAQLIFFVSLSNEYELFIANIDCLWKVGFNALHE